MGKVVHQSVDSDMRIYGSVKTGIDNLTKYVEPTGTTNDTSYIQKIFNQYNNIVLKKGTYFVDGVTKLVPPANRTITFEEGAILQCITNSSDSYRVLELINENITVINPQIIGDRTTHTGSTGEQGHGIFVGNANNIKVINPVVKNCWGDGIYILNRSGKILIDNPVCDNNRRQGISIVSADDLTINSPTCSNTNGISPQAGIDIEPTFAEDVFNHVKINNPNTLNNVGVGITVSLNMIKTTNKRVNISIVNHNDDGSLHGFSCFNNNAGVFGKISNVKPYYKNNDQNGIYIRSCEAVGTPVIEIDSPIVLNANESNSGASTAQNGIFIHRPVGDAGSNPIGNVIVRNARVIDDRTTSQTIRGIYMRDEKDITTQKIFIIDPLEIKGIANTTLKVVLNPSGVYFRDNYQSNVIDVSSNLTFGAYYSQITNLGAVAKTVYTLNYPLIMDATTKFINKTSTGLQIKPEAGAKILPLSSVAGKYIETTQIGASIVLKKVSATEYYIESITGTWTVEA